MYIQSRFINVHAAELYGRRPPVQPGRATLAQLECARALDKSQDGLEPSLEIHLYRESDSGIEASGMLPSTPKDEAMYTPCTSFSGSCVSTDDDDLYMQEVKVLHDRLNDTNAAHLRMVCLLFVLCFVHLPFSRPTALSKLSITNLVNILTPSTFNLLVFMFVACKGSYQCDAPCTSPPIHSVFGEGAPVGACVP